MPTNIKKEGNFDLFMSCNSIFSQHTFVKLLSKFEMHVQLQETRARILAKLSEISQLDVC